MFEQVVHMGMLLDAIENALDGNEPSDFELSYPIVRRTWEMRQLIDRELSDKWKEAEQWKSRFR